MTTNDREECFRQWLADHAGLMLKVVRAFTACPEDGEDLFQEILLQVWISIPAFREESKPSTWIYRLALNTALHWHRGRDKRRRSHTLPGEVAQTVAAASCDFNASEQADLLQRLYAEIRNLKEIDRSLILMYLDGLTYCEMAEVLGISESNVGVRISRTKKRLAESMKGQTDGL